MMDPEESKNSTFFKFDASREANKELSITILCWNGMGVGSDCMLLSVIGMEKIMPGGLVAP